MNVGFIGVGKLGLPCALTLADAGHVVSLFDVSPRYLEILAGDVDPPQEAGIGDLIRRVASEVRGCKSIGHVVERSDVIFVAVQTPHSPEYGGHTEAPSERRDFDYTALTGAVREVCAEALVQEKHVTVVVVSTALPGSFNRHLRPLANRFVTLTYGPAFIAMGTTIADYTNPEFVLLGADDPADLVPVKNVYRHLHDRPFAVMSIESAELCKVAYNTFISQKIVFGNTLMEICHKTGADCDQVVDGLTLATQRVTSAAYMRGGMGDGGACHPRDLIAMSWLAERLDLSTDLMGYLVSAREDQSRWLRDLVRYYSELYDLPIALLGAAYKPGSDLVAGSPALLLAEQLQRTQELWESGTSVEIFDPHVAKYRPLPPSEPHVFVVTCKHETWQHWDFAPGSVVLDPFGYIPDQPGVTVVRIGRKR